ncbi:MAG: 4Fe-4S binding protein, partial [Bacilli bacterium]|nr:4Fe-4S binding protein [Bacilli bacterium]
MDNYILDIQRMSTEDGPGIRTTVFFKGCNLKCSWCHNPESISPKREKYWVKDKCMACFSCRDNCPKQAISFDDEGMMVSDQCQFCLVCVDNCPTNAIEVKGEKYEVNKL